MTSTQVIREESGIVRVKLNQPEIHNAFDDALILELTKIFKDIDADASARVMILEAEGKSFSAGANLNWMRRMANYSRDENYEDSMALAELMQSLYSLKIPTIANVQGSAFGGGVGLIACCDIAIASERAKFCLSEVKLGLIPAVISPYVIEAMGSRAASRYFVTAELFDAVRAAELGLVSEVCSSEELNERVNTVANTILSNGPEAVVAAKALVRDVSGQNIDRDLMALTSARIADIRASEQGKEGVTAFLEKRPAKWLEE